MSRLLFQRPDVLYWDPCLFRLTVDHCRLEAALADCLLGCTVKITRSTRLLDLRIHHPTINADQERNRRRAFFFVTSRGFRVFRFGTGAEVSHCRRTARTSRRRSGCGRRWRRRCRRSQAGRRRRRVRRSCDRLLRRWRLVDLHLDRRDERRRWGLHFRRWRRRRSLRWWWRFDLFDQLCFHCFLHLRDHLCTETIDDPPGDQDVQQDHNGDTSEILPRFLLM
jgi:hypothetical protein